MGTASCALACGSTFLAARRSSIAGVGATSLENRGLDIAQPEVCALGGVSEYLRVLGAVPCALHAL